MDFGKGYQVVEQLIIKSGQVTNAKSTQEFAVAANQVAGALRSISDLKDKGVE